MARKTQKKKTKKAKKISARKPAAKKARAAAKATSRTTRSRTKAGANTEVERRWQEYWDCRKRLEEAVETVRGARESLQHAQEAERARRVDFDKIKGSLTSLLEVDPASPGQSRPVQLAADSPGGQASRPPKQIG